MAHYDSSAMYDGSAFYDEAPPITPKKRMAKVKLDLRKKSDAELLTFGQQHILAMTGNANFTTPTPTAAAFQTLYDDYEAALDAADLAQQTAKEKTVLKETARLALEQGLNDRASYVQQTSGGDEAKILSASLGVKAASTAIGELPAPGNLRASGGDMEGEIDLHWDPVHGANSYPCEYATSPSGPWTSFYGGKKSSCTVEGLDSGTLYYFRVRRSNRKLQISNFTLSLCHFYFTAQVAERQVAKCRFGCRRKTRRGRPDSLPGLHRRTRTASSRRKSGEARQR